MPDYRYNLYQEPLEDSRLDPGITRSISKYINETQKDLEFIDNGIFKGDYNSDGNDNRLRIFPEILVNNNIFSVIVGTIFLRKMVFAIKGSCAYITCDSLSPNLNLPLNLYYSYFAAVSILCHHIRALTSHYSNELCSFNLPFESSIIKEVIFNKLICSECHSKMEKYEVNALGHGPIDSALLIMNRVSWEYRKQFNNTEEILQSRELAEEQPKFASSGRGISFSSIGEKAVTGHFGAANDNDNPPDALGYQEYADALASVIVSKETETPISIAICSPWGRGKSVLLEYLKNSVKEKSDNCICIRFNAWEYTKAEHIWIEFYKKIIADLEKNLKRFPRLLFKHFYFSKAYPSKYYALIGCFVLAMLFLIISQSLVLLYPIGFLILILTIGKMYTVSKIAILSFLSIPLLTAIVGWLSSLSAAVFYRTTIIKFDKSSEIGHEVFHRLEIISNWLLNNNNKRIVILIDDIDRCPPGQILEVLESIKLFLNIKQFVFCIALDAKVVNCAIGDHYKFMCDPETQRENMGRLYLEKIIQIPFHLPELSKRQMLKYHYTLFSRHLKNIVIEPEIVDVTDSAKLRRVENTTPEGNTFGTEISGKGVKNEIKNTEDKETDNRARIGSEEEKVMRSVLEIDDFKVSPRLWKRYMNIYMIARHLLIRENENSRKPIDGFVPSSCFIKWLALSVVYPYESMALMKWWDCKNWQEPKGIIFDKDGYHNVALVQSGTSGIIQLHPPFNELSYQNFDRFGQIYVELQIDPQNIKKTKHIINCFNLVLE